MPFRQGEIGEGEFPRKGVLLSTSFSGDFLHFLQLECLSLSFVTMEGGLREKGHLENQGGVVSLQLERLKQPADAGHRLEQPAAGNHF